MKIKLYLMALMAAPILFACNKQEAIPDCAELGSGNVTLTVNVPAVKTKAMDAESVENLTVFVFNEDGTQVEASAQSSTSDVEVSVSIGTKIVAAVVNYPGSLSSFTGVDELESIISTLQDNRSSLVMYGKTAAIAVTASSNVDVNVSRLVSRVKIGKIINALTGPHAGQDIDVNAVYLVNVAGDASLGVACGNTYEPSAWYNKRRNATSVDGLVSEDCDFTIGAADEYETDMTFYCCPNPTLTDSSSEAWCPRFTRLVVEATIAGKTWYYPISVPALRSNHSYEIPSLTITRLGSTDPDVPVEVGTAGFNVVVNEWVVVPGTQVTI